ncbi:hypothetical protein Pyn_20424 [Prunus yedoensis var. nudiflora]|uniref:Uncharacterized protein n=1 Tax=Prunus yedoensis var. nudiflora TaxID=2094558 RepID=A0A314Y5Y3_PRUYE|nr:hypothetical protein Pyn_20424 [Prunus yedoensis var. nudiflora]
MSENSGQAAQEVSVEMEFDDLCSEQDVQEAIKKLADRLNKFQVEFMRNFKHRDEQYKTVLTEKLQRADNRSLIHGGDLDSSLAN